MKVLLIEDNLRLSERVKHHLGGDFIVDIANTSKEGKVKALTSSYAVILLDLHLPDSNGFELCQQLRKANITTPILIISGTDDAGSRVELLDSGADDYLVKPFDPHELAARIRALLRRHRQGYDRHILTVKDLTIDVNRRHVQRAGKDIILSRKEFDILEYLVSNCGRTVTRNMILDHAWDTTKENWHNSIDVHIKYLRDKVDRPFDSPLIKTTYGVGYMVDDST